MVAATKERPLTSQAVKEICENVRKKLRLNINSVTDTHRHHSARTDMHMCWMPSSNLESRGTFFIVTTYQILKDKATEGTEKKRCRGF